MAEKKDEKKLLTGFQESRPLTFSERIKSLFTGKLPEGYYKAAFRKLPPEEALLQQKEQIFDLWRSEEYWRMIAKRYLPDLGLGFSTSPYIGPWEYVWGVTPVEDLTKYKEIYLRDPVVHNAVNVIAHLSTAKGFTLLTNSPDKGQIEFLQKKLNEISGDLDFMDLVRMIVFDMLVFGVAYLEVIRLFTCDKCEFQDDRLEFAVEHEKQNPGHQTLGEIRWLKPIPPETMRINRDPWGTITGFTQILTFPPIHFLPSEIIYFRYNAKSWNYECFTPDTLVRTSNGFKKISDVKIGDKVIMHTGKWGEVLQVKSFPIDEELIEIRTSHSNIPILSTPTHPYYARPLYISSGGFKKLQSEQFVLAQNLKPKDYLLVPIDREEKDVPYILLSDYLDISTLNRVAPNKSKIHTKIQVNADFMYLVGLFLGDGCVTRDTITFAFNGLKEEQLAQETKELINNVFGLRAWITKPKNTNRIEVHVKSRYLSKLFKMWFNEGAHNKSIPEWMMKLPPYKQLHLLRGLFDSDGFAKKDGKSITISTVSENMAHQIYTLFLRQNQIPSIHKRTPKINKPFKDGHIAHSGTIYNITVYVRKTTKRGNGWAKGRIENDYLWLPIKSVKRVHYKGSVWNLEVDKEHTFTVGIGYAVHNSAYGISLLRPILRVQALIKEFEDVIGAAMWSYNFPKFIVYIGQENQPPPTDEQTNQIIDAFSNRGPQTDIYVRHGSLVKDVKVITPPTAPLQASEWWLKYLLDVRGAALGVPNAFTGLGGGASGRSSADSQLQFFVSRLIFIQNILSKKIEDEIFKPLIRMNFGDDAEVPHIVWQPILDEPTDIKVAKAIQLFNAGIINIDEARSIVGMATLDKNVYGDMGKQFNPKVYQPKAQAPPMQEDEQTLQSDKKEADLNEQLNQFLTKDEVREVIRDIKRFQNEGEE